MTEVELSDDGDSATPDALVRPWDLNLVTDGPFGLYEPVPLPNLVQRQDNFTFRASSFARFQRRLQPTHEVFIKTDFGLAQGPFKPDLSGQVVKSHKLKLVGRHQVQVWVQERDERGFPFIAHKELFDVWVDPYAPSVRLETITMGQRCTPPI